MKQVYIRRLPSTQERVTAAAVAIGLGTAIGAAAYYLARAFLARDAIPLRPDPARRDELEGEVEGFE